MSSRRQPLITLSPSQGDTFLGSPTSKCGPPPQITPKLPRKERLNSLSRLLKNRSFASEVAEPPVRIQISPMSIAEEKRTLTKEFPFSPQTLSPASPRRSPLYSPDRKRIFLGRGSFGKVTLCQYKGKKMAVKMLHKEWKVVGEKNLLHVCHPHLVQVYHISELLDGTKLVFMEFAGHCNLQQILDTKSELDFRRRLSFCIQIVKGLHHCHTKGIVHGDVKPANVMVSTQGVCKLGDFGLSYRLEAQPTSAQDMLGTAAYAAPEVLKGSIPGPAADVFSLGILLWQVHAREVPFAGEHPHVIIYKVVNYDIRPKFRDKLNPVLSSFAKVAESCWSSHPPQRLSAQQALAALQDIMRRIKEEN